MEIADALEAALASATAKVAELTKQLDELEAERLGLELALARYRREPKRLPPQSPTRSVTTVDKQPPANISDAVLQVLWDADRPLAPSDVVQRLQGAGQPLSSDQV